MKNLAIIIMSMQLIGMAAMLWQIDKPRPPLTAGVVLASIIIGGANIILLTRAYL